jgi:magnesium-protoporphyrin IX monomethyl ester (oxidative) cyclase
LIKLNEISIAMEAAHRKGGLMGKIKKGFLGMAAGYNFLRLYMLPTHKNEIPETSRLQPVW